MKREIVGKYKNIRHFIVSLREVLKNKYPAKSLIVIGVTGTDGKTTTCHLIHEILKTAGKKTALVSTIGAFVDNETIDTGFHTTTPDATFLQPLLRKMVDKKIEYLVMEATSHGLDQHRVLGCNFKIGVFTNVTHEHYDYHKTFENYRRAKAKLFKKVKIAILNKDDPSFGFFKNVLRRNTRVISYSLRGPSDIRLTQRRPISSGTEFFVKSGSKKIKFSSKLIGDYNLSNILAAGAVARSLNISWLTIQKAVANFTNVSGRMEVINCGQPFTAVVDFAHTPNALENILKTLKRVKKKTAKIICVFGCAGERDKDKRPAMGKIATRLADVSIFTAEDPRSEDVNDIIDQIAMGVSKNTSEVKSLDISEVDHFHCHYFLRKPDRRKAIELAIKIVKPNDIVIVCGKGHEKSMCFGKTEIPWSDQKEIVRAIEKFKMN